MKDSSDYQSDFDTALKQGEEGRKLQQHLE